MNDRDIEDTRMPDDEDEQFECALCENFYPLLGKETVINDKRICADCSIEDADQMGFWDRMFKAERKVKNLTKRLLDNTTTNNYSPT